MNTTTSQTDSNHDDNQWPTEPDDSDMVCECEWDWRCGLHQGMYTPQELANDEWAKQEDCPWWAQ